MRHGVVLPMLVACIVIAATCDCGVEAQDSRRAQLIALIVARKQAHVLARICVSEGGWGNPIACAAYHTSLRARAAMVPGLSWDGHGRTYTRLFNPHRPPSRLWLLGLDESDVKPIGWPAQLPWQTARDRHGRQVGRLGYLDRWHDEVAVAAVLVETPRNPCDGTPTDWGSGDVQEARYRAQYPRAVRINCPGAGDDRFFRPSPE